MFTRWILERKYVTTMTNDNTQEYAEGKSSARHLTGRAKLFAARMRLQNALDREDALEAIREVVANLIGAEELAIFKADKQKAALWLYWSSGIDAEKYPYLDAIREPLLEEVLAGKSLFNGDQGREKLVSLPDPVSALVPIKIDQAVAGVLVIFRLLPQKDRLESEDRKMCEAISTYGGQAL
jgi:transcriptional regulator with GAF, ATPase, and Fis domain